MARTLAVAAPGKPRRTKSQPTPEQIQLRAYEIFLQRAGRPGSEIQDWLQAELELTTATSKPRKAARAAKPKAA